MDGNEWMKLILLLESSLICVLFVFLPRISRQGLLFGVYVGEGLSAGGAARALRDTWMRWAIAILIVVLVLSAAALWFVAAPWSFLVAALLPLFAFFPLYLRFHTLARELRGPYVEPTWAAATLVPAAGRASQAPLFVLALCLGLALVQLAYVVDAWPRLPERIPIHFNASGQADGWAQKSMGSVFMVPVLALVMAFVLGGTTWLVSRAKRALRADDRGRSFRAQQRFRTAMTWYMGGIAVITQVMFTTLGILSVQVGLGLRDALGSMTWVFLVVLLVWTFGGLVFLMVRVGQGGARLEEETLAPLTNGLADDRYWKAGLIYINRDDPSILVENRFGLGYTINLGNPWAVLFLILVLAGPLAITAVALIVAA